MTYAVQGYMGICTYVETGKLLSKLAVPRLGYKHTCTHADYWLDIMMLLVYMVDTRFITQQGTKGI